MGMVRAANHAHPPPSLGLEQLTDFECTQVNDGELYDETAIGIDRNCWLGIGSVGPVGRPGWGLGRARTISRAADLS